MMLLLLTKLQKDMLYSCIHIFYFFAFQKALEVHISFTEANINIKYERAIAKGPK